MTRLTIYHGAAEPIRISGKHCVRLASFAQKFPGWHSYTTDRATVRAVATLQRLGCLEVSPVTCQFRFVYPKGHSITETQLDVAARHYIIAALWADSEEGTHPQATREAYKQARESVLKFVDIIGPQVFARLLDAAQTGYGKHADCGTIEPAYAAMGHDLWLTRQGHGVGFWGRDELPDDLGKLCTDACTAMGSPNYEFYRGWLYLRAD